MKVAAEAGFDLAGIAAVEDAPELEYFPRWIAEGRAGEMKYLEARDDQGLEASSFALSTTTPRHRIPRKCRTTASWRLVIRIGLRACKVAAGFRAMPGAGRTITSP